VPLALELAAARARDLSLGTIVTGLTRASVCWGVGTDRPSRASTRFAKRAPKSMNVLSVRVEIIG